MSNPDVAASTCSYAICPECSGIFATGQVCSCRHGGPASAPPRYSASVVAAADLPADRLVPRLRHALATPSATESRALTWARRHAAGLSVIALICLGLLLGAGLSGLS